MTTDVLTLLWLEPWRFILQARYQMAQKQCLSQLFYLCLGHVALELSLYHAFLIICVMAVV